ncbi:MAG TPA: 30S ribosomal protein S2, partial [Solirubrobacteraceae bacterium]|nr:30S ribosomal protein S2 [Solirubrobacteraceae bacterium]
MAQVSIRELLEAGVHFGHQTRRWNPKMRRFIHGERGGNYIIDLMKTLALLEQAQRFASDIAHRGGTVLFVGTKKQARDAVKEIAESADMPFVNHRWLGGLLTNFQTINQRIKRLHDLEHYESEGQLELLPTRERMAAQADLAKLRANLGGVKNMQRVPDAMFVIDLKTEVIAVREAQRLRIPIIGLVDTNCDPDGIDYVVPGNDDAIRSCALITRAIGSVVAEGHSIFRAEEERVRKEAAERAGMPYVHQRWLGGLLTNFQTVSKRIKRLHDLNDWVESGSMELLPTRERINAMNEREKLTNNLGGVRNLQRPPDAIFFCD